MRSTKSVQGSVRSLTLDRRETSCCRACDRLWLAWISHAIFQRSINSVSDFWLYRQSRDFVALGGARGLGLFRAAGGSEEGSRWAGDDAAVVARSGGACQRGEPRALAVALRRRAASPQTAAVGQPDAMAILMRRTLTLTSAPILSSLRRMVPQLALSKRV